MIFIIKKIFFLSLIFIFSLHVTAQNLIMNKSKGVTFVHNSTGLPIYIKNKNTVDTASGDLYKIEYRPYQYFVKISGIYDEEIIEDKFTRNVVVTDNLDSITYYRYLSDKSLIKSKVFYINYPQIKTYIGKSLALQILEPINNIPPGKIVGYSDNLPLKNASDNQAYDPLMGSKKNMAEMISEELTTAGIECVFTDKRNRKKNYISTITGATVQPVIKHFYVKEQVAKYFFDSPANPLPNVLIRRVYDTYLDMEWVVNDSLTYTTRIINSVRVGTPKMAFAQALKLSCANFCSIDSLEPMLKQITEQKKQIFLNHEVTVNCSPKNDIIPSINEMLQKTNPSVVTVHDKTNKSFGSGFFIDNDGHIITNFHVIKNADKLTVQVHNDTTNYSVVIKRVNEEVDLALLQIEYKNENFVSFVFNEEPEVGSGIIAIGTPGDPKYQNSVTKGIISGVREFDKKSYIQTDASINPGNSGGPLLNEEGRLVGVVVSKFIGYGYEGISFAIPSKKVIEGLMLTPKVPQ